MIELYIIGTLVFAAVASYLVNYSDDELEYRQLILLSIFWPIVASALLGLGIASLFKRNK